MPTPEPVRLPCLLLLVLAACQGGGAREPERSTATAVMPSVLQGSVDVAVTLTSPTAAVVDVVVEVSRDGGATFRPARVEGAAALLATPAGSQHTLRWDTLGDLGFRPVDGGQLRIRTQRLGQNGAAAVVALAPAENLELALAAIDHPFLHYGPVDAAAEALAKRHDLVVLHPSVGAVTVDAVRRIQNGADPLDPADDVLVLGYLSIGEDQRTIGRTDAQLLQDPRFVGDGSGPRVDPRGPNADGSSLVGIDPLGAASNGGGGYASWFLDDNSVDRSGTQTGDGLPDRNAYFGGCFVNAGDPAWFEALQTMTIDGPDGVPGMRELLTADFGRGYGFDGLFFDTIDTCAPNSFTDPTSGNQSEFEWTAPGFAQFFARFKAEYPTKLALQNRGLFFYDPRHPHYRHNPRGPVDLLLFESYRLNSNSFETFNPYFFADNKFNIAPKLMAEANRPDGFTVISLGYAEGPGIDRNTLLGTSTVGAAELQRDVDEAERLAGFRHYITDAGVALANAFVRDLPRAVDGAPPVWSNTFNAQAFPWPTPAGAPTPSIGLSEAVPGLGQVTLRWDVAMDQNRVGYALYRASAPFDFLADPTLQQAARTVVVPEVGADYPGLLGVANQTTVTGLTPGVTQYFCLRAFDVAGNEERNEVVLSAAPRTQVTITIDGTFGDWAGVPLLHEDPADVPASAGPDWRELRIGNDATNLYGRFGSDDPFHLDGSPTFGFSRTLVFFDLDGDASTGWAIAGIGSDVLLNGDGLYRQQAGVFNAGVLGTIAIEPRVAITDCEFAIPLATLRAVVPGFTTAKLVFLNDDASDFAPDAGSRSYTLVP
jgi:hypothetical protein